MKKSKSNKSKKSLSRGRQDRKILGKKLQDRVKLGQERSQGKRNSILEGNAGVPNWYPKDGTHIIDVIPYNAGKADPLVKKGDPTYGLECWVHTRLGLNNELVFLCPTEMYDEPCPICEHRQKLRDKNVDKEIWKKLFPKRRNLYNVICYDKGEEKKGVQIWDISYHYFEKFVIAISKKPSRHGKADKLINFACPEEGKSISFTIEPAKGKEDYPTYMGHSFDDRDYEIDEEILEAAITLDEAVHHPTYEEISDVYWSKSKKDKSKKSSNKSNKKNKTRDADNDDDDDDDNDGDDNKLDELLDELEDLDDMDELKEFIEDNDIDIKIKRKDDEDDIKDKIIEELEDKFDDDDDDDDGNDDDDIPF